MTPIFRLTLTMKGEALMKFLVDQCYQIHKTMGPGLFESVYEEIFASELERHGIPFDRQVGIPVVYNGKKLELGFLADLIVAQEIIIEIKSVEILAPVHFKQLLNYLRLTNNRLGLLVNFNEGIIKDGLRRVVNGY